MKKLLFFAFILFLLPISFSHAGVSTVLNTTCREGTGFSQNNDDFITAQFNDAYLNLQYIQNNTAGNTCNKGLILFDTARTNNTITSVKIDWEVDTLISSTCTLYVNGMTQGVGGNTISTPHYQTVSSYSTLVSTTTDTVRRTDTITNPISNTDQFVLAWGGGSGQEGCVWKIYSIRDQNDVDIMRNTNISPTTADSSGGGGGSTDVSGIVTAIEENNLKDLNVYSVALLLFIFVCSGILLGRLTYKII